MSSFVSLFTDGLKLLIVTAPAKSPCRSPHSNPYSRNLYDNPYRDPSILLTFAIETCTITHSRDPSILQTLMQRNPKLFYRGLNNCLYYFGGSLL